MDTNTENLRTTEDARMVRETIIAPTRDVRSIAIPETRARITHAEHLCRVINLWGSPSRHPQDTEATIDMQGKSTIAETIDIVEEETYLTAVAEEDTGERKMSQTELGTNQRRRRQRRRRTQLATGSRHPILRAGDVF